MKLPYWSVRSSGTLPTSKSVSSMPSIAGLRLDLAPGRHAAIGAFDQLAGRDRLAVGVEHVLAQEHLVRRVRGVGLVLVDKRGRGVDGRTSSAVPMTPSGPAETVARVSTMKLVWLPST